MRILELWSGLNSFRRTAAQHVSTGPTYFKNYLLSDALLC